MDATLHSSRFWLQIGEIDYQRQFVAARKKLETLGVEIVKGWMDRDDEDEVSDAIFIVDVPVSLDDPFKRQADRLGWACRLVSPSPRPDAVPPSTASTMPATESASAFDSGLSSADAAGKECD